MCSGSHKTHPEGHGAICSVVDPLGLGRWELTFSEDVSQSVPKLKGGSKSLECVTVFCPNERTRDLSLGTPWPIFKP